MSRLREALRALQDFIERLFQHLRVQQLLAVLPFVQRLGLVETFVTLQADQRQIEHFGGRLRQLGLAHAGRPLDQHRLAQVIREINGGRDLFRADVTMRFEVLLQRWY
jgi:hypothetical protein